MTPMLSSARGISRGAKLGAASTAAALMLSVGMAVGLPQVAYASDVTSSMAPDVTAAADPNASDIIVNPSEGFQGLVCAVDKDTYSLAFGGTIKLPPFGQRLNAAIKQALVESTIPDTKRDEAVDQATMTGALEVTTVVDADIDINVAALTPAKLLAAHQAANPNHPLAAVIVPTAATVTGKSVRVTYSPVPGARLRTVVDAALDRAEMRFVFPEGAFSMSRSGVEKGGKVSVTAFRIEGTVSSVISYDGSSNKVAVKMLPDVNPTPVVSLDRRITPAVVVNYVSGTEGKALPAELAAKAPAEVTYPSLAEKPANPAAPAEKSFAASDGTWTFGSYRPAAQAQACGKSFYEGVWTFTSNSGDDQGAQPAPKDAPKGKDDNASNSSKDNKAQSPDVTAKKVDQAKTEPAHRSLARTGFGAGIVTTGVALLIAGAAALVVRRRA